MNNILERTICDRQPKNTDANCIGTTLYLLGQSEVVSCIDPRTFVWDKHFVALNRTPIRNFVKPTAGQAILVVNKSSSRVLHAATIHPLNNQYLLQRECSGAPLEIVPVENALSYFREINERPAKTFRSYIQDNYLQVEILEVNVNSSLIVEES